MSDKIYCYPNSDVLINKLNIHDADKLYEAERKLTMLRLIDLLDKPIHYIHSEKETAERKENL